MKSLATAAMVQGLSAALNIAVTPQADDISPMARMGKKKRNPAKSPSFNLKPSGKYTGAKLRKIREVNGVGRVKNHLIAEDINRRHNAWQKKKFGDTE